MKNLTPLPNIILRPMVERALTEDFGNSGDVTARLLVPESATGSLVMRAREAGIIAGMQAAQMTYDLVDPKVEFEVVHPTGSDVDEGDIIARISGPFALASLCRTCSLEFPRPYVGRSDTHIEICKAGQRNINTHCGDSENDTRFAGT